MASFNSSNNNNNNNNPSSAGPQPPISRTAYGTPETPTSPTGLAATLNQPQEAANMPPPPPLPASASTSTSALPLRSAGKKGAGGANAKTPASVTRKGRQARTPGTASKASAVSSAVRSPVLTRSARKSAQAAAKFRSQQPTTKVVATALDMAGEGDDDVDDLVQGGAGAAETAAEIVIPAVVPEGGLPAVSEEEFEAAPMYLRMQVDRSRLNRAVAALNAAVVSRGGPGTPWEGALSGTGVKEDLVRGALEAMGEAPDGAKTLLLCLGKLQRVKIERRTGNVYFRKQ